MSSSNLAGITFKHYTATMSALMGTIIGQAAILLLSTTLASCQGPDTIVLSAGNSSKSDIQPSTTQPSSPTSTQNLSNPTVETPTPSNTTQTPTPTQTPYVNLEKSMLIAYDCNTGEPLPSDGPDTSFKAAYDETSDRRNTRPSQLNTGELNKRSIIGNDERLRVAVGSESRFPYCSIGAIPSIGCTGFFVSPKHALTAAHCVFDELGNWLGAPNIRRAQNCKILGIFHECTKVYVPKGWTDPSSSDEQCHYDYALILFEKASPCHMSFGFAHPWPELGLSVVGYPDSTIEADVCMCSRRRLGRRRRRRRRRAMCYGYSGNSVTKNKWFLDHQSDTLPGNSGSPLYASDLNIQPPSLQVVYGIHTDGADADGGRPDRNRGVRITKHLWHQFVQRIEKDGQDVTVAE